MDTIWQDIKYGIRSLGKTPAFTLVVALTLGLGIGANTAIFSVVNAFLLRPLPVRDAQQLAVLSVVHEGNDSPHQVSYLDYADWRAQSDAFSDISALVLGFVGVSTGERPERVLVSFVTPNYFPMLGIQPAHGQLNFAAASEKPGADPVLVLGHGYWKKRFGADPGVIGRSVKLNGQPFTVIGVVPEEFTGTYALTEMAVYAPLGAATLETSYRDLFTKRDAHSMRVLARLKSGVSFAQAQSSLDVVAKRLEQQYPDTNKTVRAQVFAENMARPEPNSSGQNPLVAAIFLLLTILVLVVACVNVANLLLVRATTRQKELAIRAALGAGPKRLVRQLLTESLLLSTIGGACGILLGGWLSRVLAAVRLPGDLPFRFDFGFDWRVFGFVSASALLAGVIVGVLPAWRASRADLNQVLRETGCTMSAGRHRLRNTLVVVQVAGSLVLLIAAGLFVRSLGKARTFDLGFDRRNVLCLSMDVAQKGYDEARGRAFYRELEQRLRALPGVESVSLAFSVPMGYYSNGSYVFAEGQEPAPSERRPAASYNMVTPDYFSVMRIPLLRGRAFTATDNETGRRVAIVNERLAEKFWPGKDPIGQRFRAEDWKDVSLEVVGVARNSKTTWIFDEVGLHFYVPADQQYSPLRVAQLRTTGAPLGLVLAAQKEIHALDPDLPVYDVVALEEHLNGGNGFFLIRMGATIAGALGALGLALAVIGVYAVVSYTAGQRTQEIGIRLALGAQRGEILRMILAQGFKLVGTGLAAGLVLSFFLSRALANFLFGLSAQDPVTFGGVLLLLSLVALVACLIPARRATRVDPLVALRHE
jgi:predicted permease